MHKTPNRNLAHRRRTGHPLLHPLHLRNIPNPTNRQSRPLGPSLFDLPNRPRSHYSLKQPAHDLCRQVVEVEGLSNLADIFSK